MPGDYFTSKAPDNSVFFPNCFGGRELFLTVPLDFPLLCPQDMGFICHICRTALIKLSLEQKVICFCGFFFLSLFGCPAWLAGSQFPNMGPGLKPMPRAVKVCSLNCWTSREVLRLKGFQVRQDWDQDQGVQAELE